MVDHALTEHDRLVHSRSAIDTILENGAGVLEGLQDQRRTLKGAQRRILDIANTLGLSNTVMRMIERRSAQDKLIFTGGVVLSLFIMWATIHYLT